MTRAPVFRPSRLREAPVATASGNGTEKQSGETPPVFAAPSVRPISERVRIMTGVPDRVFQFLMFGCALAVLVALILIVVELVRSSQLSLHQFGWRFFLGQNWNPVSGEFGALPFIYGTIVSSLVALVLAVPLGLGVAVFITEMCPPRLRGGLS